MPNLLLYMCMLTIWSLVRAPPIPPAPGGSHPVSCKFKFMCTCSLFCQGVNVFVLLHSSFSSPIYITLRQVMFYLLNLFALVPVCSKCVRCIHMSIEKTLNKIAWQMIRIFFYLNGISKYINAECQFSWNSLLSMSLDNQIIWSDVRILLSGRIVIYLNISQ